jgi:hypothetical protein
MYGLICVALQSWTGPVEREEVEDCLPYFHPLFILFLLLFPSPTPPPFPYHFLSISLEVLFQITKPCRLNIANSPI